MTITYLGEIHGPAKNSKGSKSYTRSFKLQTSLKTERAYHVGSHASLPVIGEVHPDDSTAYCVDLSVDPVEPWKGWAVTAEYSTERALAEDPTSDPALISWNSEQFQRPAIVDKNGDAIVNSAGDPFDPPEMIDDARRVVTIQKNLASVPAWILTYQDAVNSDTFNVDGVSVAVGKAKMQSVTVGELQTRNSTSFRTVTFTIHFRYEGWLLRPLDAGFRELDYAGTLQNIKNEGDDELPGAPVPLDGDGHALALPTPSTAVALSFDVYRTQAFSSLPLT